MAVVVGTAQGKLTLDASKFIANIDSSYKALKKFNDLIIDTQKALNHLPSKTIDLGIDQSGFSAGSNSWNIPNINPDPDGNIPNTTKNVNLLKDALGTGLSATLSGVGKLAEVTFSTFLDYTKQIAGFAKESLEFGTQFDATMSQVGAISKADGEELEALRNTAIDMGEETKFSASEAAQAMVYMGMAGWDTQQIIDGLSGVMNLAAASGEDLATTSDIVTDALTAFGLTADDSAHFADVLAEASTDSNTNVALMGETFKYVASLAGTMKYNIEDTSVAIGLMANSGIKGSQAGTALRNIISNLASPTEKSAAAMAALGISLVDSEGNTKSLMDTMKDLRDAFSNLSTDGSLEAYQALIDDLNSSLESGMITQEEYDDAVANASANVLQSLDTLQAGYASDISGKYGLSGLLAIVNASDEDFQKLTNSIYTSSTSLDVVTQAIQNSGIAWDNYLNSAQLTESGMQTIAADIVHQVQGLEKTNEEVQKHLQLEYGINADDAIKAIWSVEDALEESEGAANKMSDKMMDNLQGSITYFESAMGTLKIRVSDVLKNPTNEFVQLGTESIKRLTTALESGGTPGLIQEVGAIIPDIAEAVVQDIPEVLPSLLSGFWALVNGVIDAIPTALPTIIDGATTLFLGLVTGLDDASGKLVLHIPFIIDTISNSLLNNADTFLDAAIDLFLNLVEGATKALPKILKTAAKLVKKIAKKLVENRGKILDAGIKLLMELIVALTDPETLKDIGEAIWSIVTLIIDTFGKTDWLETANTIFSGLGDALLNIFELALNSIDELLGTDLASWGKDVRAFFDDLKQQSFQFGWDLAQTMNKTEIELNELSTKYSSQTDSFRRMAAELIKGGVDVRQAMAAAYQKYFTSAEAQYLFKERIAKDYVSASSEWGQAMGTTGWSGEQLAEFLAKTQVTTGNTYNFYSPKAIDEKTAADEIRKANKDALLGA